MTAARPQHIGEPSRGVRRVTLFVAKGEPNSVRAQANLDRICTQLENGCEITVVDVIADCDTALAEGVLVTPCLVMNEPPPRVLIAGTLSDTEKVLTALRMKVG